MDNRSRWRMLALLFVCRIAFGLAFQSIGSLSAPLIAQFGFSYVQIGTLIGLFMLPGLVISFPAGLAGRYFSDRQISSFGLLLLALGSGLAAYAQGFAGLALGRLLAGVGFVLSTVYMTKMVADWFAGKELATAMSILVMSWPFGIAMSQIGHVWLAERHGWQSGFWLAGAFSLLAAIALALAYREPPSAAGAKTAAAESTLSRPELGLTLLAASAWGLFNAGYIAYLSFGPRVLVAGGLSETSAAAVASVASWLLIFSGTVCGRIVDRTGKPDRVLYICMLAAMASLLLMPMVSLALPMSALLGLVGVAPAGVIMSLAAQATPPQRRAFGMGVFFSFYFLIMTLAPPLAGWIFDRAGDPYWPLVFGAGLFGATALANAAFRNLRQRRQTGLELSST